MSKAEQHVVLISGAASGIGQRAAERFLEQGDAVHICDVSESLVADFLAANPGATGTVADAGNRDDVARVFADLQKAHDKLDILVNNVGISGPAALGLYGKQVGHGGADENMGDGTGPRAYSRQCRMSDERRRWEDRNYY